MAEEGDQSPAVAETSVVIEGATYYTRIIVPAHMAGVSPAGEFQHSKERERRFALMNSNHESEAPKEYAPRNPNHRRTVRLVRDSGMLDAFGGGAAAVETSDGGGIFIPCICKADIH